MRRGFVLAAAAALAVPGSAAAASRTVTPLRILAPAPANATVAGFKLDLVSARGARAALARASAALPRGVTVYAVLARQRRSDRVSGVVVAVNRASVVAASAMAARRRPRHRHRRITVNLRHAAIPKSFRIVVHLSQSANVVGRHRRFVCSRYFRGSDLAQAVKLAGPSLPGITIATLIQSACNQARGSLPYPAEGEFLSALNARSGSLTFGRDPQLPNQLDGTAAFNYAVSAFGVLADSGHQFSACTFPGGTCAISTKTHPNDYVRFTLSAPPPPRGAALPLTLTVGPSAALPLPFQLFGFNMAGSRFGPLLTSGPPQ
jgi:hypothetical protein